MLLKGAAAARALARPDPSIRLYVLGGPDEAGSQALVASLAAAMGPEAERIDLASADIKREPSRLVDEAAAMGLFGGARWIHVALMQGGGDEWVTAATDLLAAPVAGNPVVISGGGITNKGKLLRAVEKHPAAVAVISYLPEGADAERLASSIASPLGLELNRETAREIAAACSGDRALMARELEKLALYCDATPDKPVHADLSQWRAIGADMAEEDIGEAVNLVLDGKVAALPTLFAELAALGTSEIRLVRAIATRAQVLARLRVLVEQGLSPAAVVEQQGKAIFWKDKATVTRQLGKWNAAALSTLIERLHRLERDLKMPDNAGALLLREALLHIARQAAATR